MKLNPSAQNASYLSLFNLTALINEFLSNARLVGETWPSECWHPYQAVTSSIPVVHHNRRVSCFTATLKLNSQQNAFNEG